MALIRLHSSPSPSHFQKGDRSEVHAAAEKRSHSSLTIPVTVQASPRYSWNRQRDASIESDDGFDSDATIDLEEGLLSPALEGAPSLQRMSSEYERVVLRSLRRGKATAYACSCSLGREKMRNKTGGSSWQHIECEAETESSASDSDYDSLSDGDTEDLKLEMDHSSLVIDERAPGEFSSKKPEQHVVDACFELRGEHSS